MSEKELPAGWVWAGLEDVAEVLDSRRVPVNAKVRADRPGEVPYYGANGQVGWIDEAIFDEDLVLLGEDGVQFFDANKGKAYRVSGRSWVNNHAHVLRAKPVMDWRYLCHYLNCFSYEGYANGTTRLKLTKAAMVSIPVPLPPLAEQLRIVETLEDHLSRLDAASAEVERAQVKSDRLISAVHGRAVTGSFSRSVQFSEVMPPPEVHGVDTRHARRNRAAPLPTEVPDFSPPENWPVVSLGSLCYESGYGTSTKCAYGAPGPPVLRIPNVQGGSIDLSDVKNAVNASIDLRKYFLTAGDLLFVRTNGSPSLIGRVGVVEEALDSAFASYLIRFRISPGSVEPRWVRLVMQSPLWRREIERRAASSAGQYNLNVESLSSLPIPLPPVDVQRETLMAVDTNVEAARRLSGAAHLAKARAGHLRNSLLRQAFSGQLIPQDPTDEPAAALLARVQAERAAQPPKTKRPRRTPAAPRKTKAPAASAPTPAPSPTSAPTHAVQQEFDL